MRSRKVTAIQIVGEQSLRVQRIQHVNAVPQRVVGEENHKPGFRVDTNQVQNIGKRNACPFRDEGPAFFAGLMSDVGARREAFQLIERKGAWACNEAIDAEAPIRKLLGEVALIWIGFRW